MIRKARGGNRARLRNHTSLIILHILPLCDPTYPVPRYQCLFSLRIKNFIDTIPSTFKMVKLGD
jgi:hypothetical protein